jgi:putative sigma-54 modulation protein
MKNSQSNQRNGKTRKTQRARRTAERQKVPHAAVAITFRHVESTDAIRSYAERKFGRIARHFKRDCDVHLILAVDKHRQRGEVTIKAQRLDVTAREETKDLYSVIDSLADKAARQLQDHLEKASARRTRSASTGAIMTAIEER